MKTLRENSALVTIVFILAVFALLVFSKAPNDVSAQPNYTVESKDSPLIDNPDTLYDEMADSHNCGEDQGKGDPQTYNKAKVGAFLAQCDAPTPTWIEGGVLMGDPSEGAQDFLQNGGGGASNTGLALVGPNWWITPNENVGSQDDTRKWLEQLSGEIGGEVIQIS